MLESWLYKWNCCCSFQVLWLKQYSLSMLDNFLIWDIKSQPYTTVKGLERKDNNCWKKLKYCFHNFSFVEFAFKCLNRSECSCNLILTGKRKIRSAVSQCHWLSSLIKTKFETYSKQNILDHCYEKSWISKFKFLHVCKYALVCYVPYWNLY